ncbi:unnamed protein product, partial [Lymnaea stagnalis]
HRLECESKIDHYKFFQFSLIPAVVLSLLMAFSKHRTRLFQDFLHGRPGLVFPMDTLTRSSRVSYCCAFGTTALLVYEIILNQSFAIDYNGPIAIKALIVIVSMFIYGLVYFPIFTCLAMRTAFCYAMGSLYIWVFFGIEVYQTQECADTFDDSIVPLLRALPSLLCQAYLSISLPYRFVVACYRGNFLTASTKTHESLIEIRDSFQGRHVRNLLKKTEIIQPTVGVGNKIKSIIENGIDVLLYKREEGFRYPSRFISVMFIGGIVVYVVSFVFSYLLNIIFRANLFALYKGDFSGIPPPMTQGAVSLCVGCIKFAGFQVGYILWGYILSLIVFFLIALILGSIITLLTNAVVDWLVNKVLQIWFVHISKLLARYAFLQGDGAHLRLDNRRLFFIFTYFMFFYNIFLGLVSCLLRIIKAAVVGTLFLCRLDRSTLPRNWESFDPGFNTYQGYIHMEAAHTNPTVNVFIRLLKSLSQSRKSSGQSSGVSLEMTNLGSYNQLETDGESGEGTTNLAARFNWHVAYTLLLNPGVGIHRPFT